MSYPRTCSIYKLVSNKTNKIYIGSTSLALTKRFKDHLYGFKNRDNPKYKGVKCNHCLFENDAVVNIELLEEIKLETPDTKPLRELEQKYINQFRDCCCNKGTAYTAPIDIPDKTPEQIRYNIFYKSYLSHLRSKRNLYFNPKIYRPYTEEERADLNTDKFECEKTCNELIINYDKYYNKKINEGKDENKSKTLTDRYIDRYFNKLIN